MADDRDPWTKWFWADWRGDHALRRCSFGARGLWMDMLSLMHEATPYGHLLVNGKAPSVAELAQIFGGKRSEIAKFLSELSEKGVVKTDANGIYFSSRMVRDFKRKTTNKQNGKNGGNPRLGGQQTPADGITERDNREPPRSDNPPGYPSGITESDKARARVPEARSQKLEKEEQEKAAAPPADLWPWDKVLERVVDLAGIDPAKGLMDGQPIVLEWSRRGFSPDLDIIPAVEAITGRTGFKQPRTVGYFTPMIQERHDLRTAAPAPAVAAVPPAPAGPARWSDEFWTAELDRWERNCRKVWSTSRLGAEPLDSRGRYNPATAVPKRILIARGIIPDPNRSEDAA